MIFLPIDVYRMFFLSNRKLGGLIWPHIGDEVVFFQFGLRIMVVFQRNIEHYDIMLKIILALVSDI